MGGDAFNEVAYWVTGGNPPILSSLKEMKESLWLEVFCGWIIGSSMLLLPFFCQSNWLVIVGFVVLTFFLASYMAKKVISSNKRVISYWETAVSAVLSFYFQKYSSKEEVEEGRRKLASFSKIWKEMQKEGVAKSFS